MSAQPQGNEVLVNQPLLMIQNAYIRKELDADYFVADKVFRSVPVQRRSSNYWTWDVDNWLRTEAQRRAPGTPSVGSGFTATQNPLYRCYVTALHKDLDMQTEKEQLANGLMDPRETATRFVSRGLLLRRELDFADTYMRTGVWGLDMTGVASGPTTNQFVQFNQASSTPIDVLAYAADYVQAATGMEPNTILMSRQVRRVLRRNAQFLSEAKTIAFTTGTGRVTDMLLKELLEVDNIYVGRAVYNAAAEGQPKDIRPIFGKSMWIGYVDPSESANLQEPSAGYIFPWVGYMDGDAGFAGNAVYEIPMPETKSVRVEGEMAYDMRITAPALGVYLDQVVA